MSYIPLNPHDLTSENIDEYLPQIKSFITSNNSSYIRGYFLEELCLARKFHVLDKIFALFDTFSLEIDLEYVLKKDFEGHPCVAFLEPIAQNSSIIYYLLEGCCSHKLQLTGIYDSFTKCVVEGNMFVVNFVIHHKLMYEYMILHVLWIKDKYEMAEEYLLSSAFDITEIQTDMVSLAIEEGSARAFEIIFNHYISLRGEDDDYRATFMRDICKRGSIEMYIIFVGKYPISLDLRYQMDHAIIHHSWRLIIFILERYPELYFNHTGWELLSERTIQNIRKYFPNWVRRG